MISQAEPQKQITKRIVKADKTREDQQLEAKKVQLEEKQKIKKSVKKMQTKEKKITSNVEKTKVKKKPLTTKKK